MSNRKQKYGGFRLDVEEEDFYPRDSDEDTYCGSEGEDDFDSYPEAIRGGDQYWLADAISKSVNISAGRKQNELMEEEESCMDFAKQLKMP